VGVRDRLENAEESEDSNRAEVLMDICFRENGKEWRSDA